MTVGSLPAGSSGLAQQLLAQQQLQAAQLRGKQAGPKKSLTTPNTRNSQTTQAARTCVNKKIPSHSSRPQSARPQLARPHGSGSGGTNQTRPPRNSFIPSGGMVGKMASFAKKFVQHLGPEGVIQLASLSTAHMKPQNGQLVAGFAQAAALGLSVHQGKQSGISTRQAILDHAPEIVSTAINVGSSVSSGIKDLKHNNAPTSKHKPNEEFNQSAELDIRKALYLQQRNQELEDFSEKIKDQASLEIDH